MNSFSGFSFVSTCHFSYKYSSVALEYVGNNEVIYWPNLALEYTCIDLKAYITINREIEEQLVVILDMDAKIQVFLT
jgi:hypothetical protein